MTKEEARKAAEVMMAYANGKDVEYRLYGDNKWETFNGNDKDHYLLFNFSKYDYRIKKEPTYRPFENKEECWNEIQKHSPFGWVKTKHNTYGLISYIRTLNNIEEVMINVASYNFKEAFDVFTFIDGTPFGIKEE